jgi:hypothetical protein
MSTATKMKVHNFSAGPCILPQEVLRKAAESIIDFEGTGLSIIEMSHRSKPFEEVMAKAQHLVKELSRCSGSLPSGVPRWWCQPGLPHDPSELHADRRQGGLCQHR